jgi:hypothetical protein
VDLGGSWGQTGSMGPLAGPSPKGAASLGAPGPGGLACSICRWEHCSPCSLNFYKVLKIEYEKVEPGSSCVVLTLIVILNNSWM